MKLLILLSILLILSVPNPVQREIFPVSMHHYYSQKTLRDFMNDMAKMESDNNFRVVNKYGAMGKYQFKPQTLQDLNINISSQEFLNNSQIQDSVMLIFMRDNKKSLRTIFKSFVGEMYHGIHITDSGILAAAHFAGPGGVLAYFYPSNPRWNKYKTSDANGATVELYLKKFANYNVGGI